MKRKTLALLMVLLMSVSILAGCAGAGPTEKDATDYVQAFMDLICTGDYDHSIKLADVEEGKETELRDQMIQETVEKSLGTSEFAVNDEIKARFNDFMSKALSKADYTVGEAVKTEDGGYDVTVTIKPMDILSGLEDELMKRAYSDIGSLMNLQSQDELNNKIMGLMMDILDERLEAPEYKDPQDVTVHYGLLDEKEKLYGLTEEDGEKLGNALFYVEQTASADSAESSEAASE